MSSTPTFDLPTISQRLVHVENELAQLKRQVERLYDQPWYLKHAGRFADDPDFQEIVRLGKEIRDADRPAHGQ
jgi:hypothetical protein